MSSESIDRKAVFNAARRIADDDERERFLESECRGDVGALKRIRALLGALAETDQTFAIPSELGSPSESLVAEQVGSKIGCYKLLQKIGEGGFGVVFMAEQCEPLRRKVALKVIKPGMDSREVIARFEAERQALAIMEHPNIASVFDGGTTESGRPYFVMELVKGLPLTEYCDRAKLALTERLKLFIDVCRAVQHAHRKGVIHRDLKPSNVMVTLHDDRPVPKVIDFGISKALHQQLTDKTLFTAYGQMVGTPVYMSPEQAAIGGLDVDTRSDVYSLGVILYELLTGGPPFDGEELLNAGYSEMQRIIREEDPQRPSTRLSMSIDDSGIVASRRGTTPGRLSQLVRGELDWIAMTALEKDRRRRYESPARLAGDIKRFLNDERVIACPPTTLYRLGKFFRRNRWRCAIAAVVCVFLLAIAASAFVVYSTERSTKASLRVGELLAANTRRVPSIVAGLEGIRPWAEDQLREVFSNAPADSTQKLHAALALIPVDASVLPFITERLLLVPAADVAQLVAFLGEYRGELMESYTRLIEDDFADSLLKLRALHVLSILEPENDEWSGRIWTIFKDPSDPNTRKFIIEWMSWNLSDPSVSLVVDRSPVFLVELLEEVRDAEGRNSHVLSYVYSRYRAEKRKGGGTWSDDWNVQTADKSSKLADGTSCTIDPLYLGHRRGKDLWLFEVSIHASAEDGGVLIREEVRRVAFDGKTAVRIIEFDGYKAVLRSQSP